MDRTQPKLALSSGGSSDLIDVNGRDYASSYAALQLAYLGTGLVSPNPLVGCIIESTDGRLVGKGTYIYDGVRHAEVLALEQAGEHARGGTAYVSLEPHDHQGKTRACTGALIEAGIRRVVCPIEDPNPLVSGRGFERLRNAGIEVVTGILADEATKLNEKFICWHRKGRPFVHLKLAMSLDGRISLTNSVSTALSGEAALKRVHDLRHEYDAILIGGNTVVSDNPSLTDRSGLERRRKLLRVVLDNSLRIPFDSTLVTTAADDPMLVISNSKDEAKIGKLRKRAVDIAPIDARDLSSVLAELRNRSIQSVLVEGGSEVAGSFVDAMLVDKVSLIVTPIIIGGRKAPVAIGGRGAADLSEALRLMDVETVRMGEDIEITGYPTK